MCVGWLAAEGGGVSPGLKSCMSLNLLQFILCKYMRHYLLNFMNFAPRVFPMLKTHQIRSNTKKRVRTKFVNNSNSFKKVLKTTLLFLKWLRITFS